MKRTKRTDTFAVVRKLGEEARVKAVETVNQLERAFEARVTRAMSRLGVPTSREVRALAREVASLKASVQRLSRSRARA
jgi:poly(hydroxyalkanoate) granule-associated protein